VAKLVLARGYPDPLRGCFSPAPALLFLRPTQRALASMPCRDIYGGYNACARSHLGGQGGWRGAKPNLLRPWRMLLLTALTAQPSIPFACVPLSCTPRAWLSRRDCVLSCGYRTIRMCTFCEERPGLVRADRCSSATCGQPGRSILTCYAAAGDSLHASAFGPAQRVFKSASVWSLRYVPSGAWLPRRGCVPPGRH